MKTFIIRAFILTVALAFVLLMLYKILSELTPETVAMLTFCYSSSVVCYYLVLMSHKNMNLMGEDLSDGPINGTVVLKIMKWVPIGNTVFMLIMCYDIIVAMRDQNKKIKRRKAIMNKANIAYIRAMSSFPWDTDLKEQYNEVFGAHKFKAKYWEDKFMDGFLGLCWALIGISIIVWLVCRHIHK